MSTTPPSPQGLDFFRLSTCFVMFLISSIGITVNGFCFIRMWGKAKYRTIFHLLNRTRMLSNCIILLVFLVWVIPCTAANRVILPHIFNQFFGQLAGWGAYWMGPSTQTFISITRFIAAYFPFFFRSIENPKCAAVLIFICLVYCSVLFGMGMRDGCSFEYDPELISFLPNGECALGFNTFINVAFTVFFILTTSLNFVTAVRILHHLRKVKTANDRVLIERERRNWRLLAQNTIENFIYTLDVYIVWFDQFPWFATDWYQFFVNTAEWQSHVMLDGFIVLFYNRNLLKSPSSSPDATWARNRSNTTATSR